jgi:hypothetical protein
MTDERLSAWEAIYESAINTLADMHHVRWNDSAYTRSWEGYFTYYDSWHCSCGAEGNGNGHLHLVNLIADGEPPTDLAARATVTEGRFDDDTAGRSEGCHSLYVERRNVPRPFRYEGDSGPTYERWMFVCSCGYSDSIRDDERQR